MKLSAFIFDTKAGFTLTAMVASWIAITVLTLIVLNLQLQLRRLSRSEGAPTMASPFSGLVGTHIDNVLPADAVGPPPRLLLFVSSTCRSCTKVIAEAEDPSWTAPTTVVFTDKSPTAELAASLGVRITPFAVVVGRNGRITAASPVNSLDRIAPFLELPADTAAFSQPERKGA